MSHTSPKSYPSAECRVFLSTLYWDSIISLDALRQHDCDTGYELEVMFKEEITTLYYFNLYYDYGYQDITSNPAATNSNKRFPISARPKDCLMSILQKDGEIDEWFNRWMQDICDLQKQVYEAIRLQSARANHTITIEK